MPSINPCPRCGSEAILHGVCKGAGYLAQACVQCSSCSLRTDFHARSGDAVLKWNSIKRFSPDNMAALDDFYFNTSNLAPVPGDNDNLAPELRIKKSGSKIASHSLIIIPNPGQKSILKSDIASILALDKNKCVLTILNQKVFKPYSLRRGQLRHDILEIIRPREERHKHKIFILDGSRGFAAAVINIVRKDLERPAGIITSGSPALSGKLNKATSMYIWH